MEIYKFHNEVNLIFQLNFSLKMTIIIDKESDRCFLTKKKNKNVKAKHLKLPGELILIIDKRY